ncbi:MAG: hypothetical protein JNL14_19565 [Devosia sp.]|uniref:hypothetical protein n=1 Tax=Devosia sp. TaxID=1871048 RepID=UPI001A36C08B|nr:hypothetical protein [Devosia sp.]MBL8599941.1 hypothetical protein [Devosia sp.]
MPDGNGSLLAGRNVTPLTEDQIVRVTNTFLGMDEDCPVRHEATARTVFRSGVDAGVPFAEVVFGPDIFPGQNIVDANSSLSVKGAVAHEIVHYHRHIDMREINELELKHIDEALTSLEAARRFPKQLSPQDIEQLIGDAIHRLKLFVDEFRAHQVEP